MSSVGVEGPIDDLLRTIANVCVKNSEYGYVQGGHGHCYFDADLLFGGADTEARDESAGEQVIDWLVKQISSAVRDRAANVVAFIESGIGPTGLIAVRAALALRCEIPTVIVRPQRRLVRSRIKGGKIDDGSKVLLLSDVATSGKSLLRASRVIWDHAGTVVGAVVLASHEMGADRGLRQHDVPLNSLATMRQLQQYMT